MPAAAPGLGPASRAPANASSAATNASSAARPASVAACGAPRPGLTSILAIVFGLIAKRQIRERGQSGGALATAGIVIGSIGLVIAVVLIAVFILTAASQDRLGVY